MTNKNLFYFLLCIFLVGIFVTYSNHFHNDFHFDDFHTINDNPNIRHLSNFTKFFTDARTLSVLPSNQIYRPLTTLSLAVDYAIANGYDPFYFHLSTFIWFLLQGFLIYILCKKLFDMAVKHRWNNYFALFAAALYSFHTAIAETVNYIIARADIISTFFVIVALLVYIQWKNLRKYYLYLIPMFIGVLVKQPALMFPPILLVYIILFEKKIPLHALFHKSNRKGLFEALKEIIPAFILFALLYLFLERMNPETFTPGGTSRWRYLLTQPFVILHYFITFFFPTQLSADTDWGLVSGIRDKEFLIGFIFVISLIYIAFRCSKTEQYRPVSFGIAWFFISLIPTSSIIPLAEVMNDHRIFFPFVGLAWSVCWLIALKIIEKEKQISQSKNLATGIILIALLIISAYAYGTYVRNQVWHSEESLWLDVTQKSPKNGRGLMNYGVIKMGQGDYATANKYFVKALKYNPQYAALQINLGVVNNALGDPASAEAYFKKGIEFDYNYPACHYFYASFLRKQGRVNEAIQELNTTLTLSPNHINALHSLIEIYNSLGNAQKLKETVTLALSIDPGDAFAQKYQNGLVASDAIILNQSAGSTSGMSASRLLSLSLDSYNSGNYKKCIEYCEAALKLQPDFADAYNNMCAAYNNLQEWDKAIEAGKMAVKLKPDYQLAKNNLNWALQNRKK